MTKGTRRTTRIRKVHCSECGYSAWMTHKHMAVALPPCANPECVCVGQAMTCADPADAIELGYMTLDDLPRPARTALCKRMGWEDEIVRTSRSQTPGAQRSRIRKIAEPIPF